VPHMDEVKFLRDRSLRMLANAKNLLKSRDFDLAAFMAEQAAQLFIKSMILELVGDMPRTHSIRQLLSIIKSIVNKENAEKIEKFVHDNRRLLAGLEDAYLASRYFYRIYDEEEGEELVKAAEEVIKLVKDFKV